MNDELSRRLRQEGISSSAEFSPELHERTMRAVRQNRLRRSVDVMPVERWRLALAAAAAIAISVTAWWSWNSQPEIIPIASHAPPVVAVSTPAAGDLLRSADAISEAGTAPLEDIARDAKSLAAYFARQFPTISAPRNGRQL